MDRVQVYDAQENENGAFFAGANEDGKDPGPENGDHDETFTSAGDEGEAPRPGSGPEDEGFASASEDDDESFRAPPGGRDGNPAGDGGPREGEPGALPGCQTGPGDQAGPGGEAGSGPDRTRLLGVRLRRAGQVFFFPDDHLTARPGSKVIVEFEHFSAFGEVESVIFSAAPPPDDTMREHGPGRIAGLATARDIALHAENRILANEATAFCSTCIRQRSLGMKLVDVEVLHDRSKIIFYFTAPARIDFRELVKDLVRNYRTRIELRQIGVRHVTQLLGGIGNCGMVCCCHQYLRKFAPVTIKMAKEQNLFLNPAKLSGLCGRLLCCLSFEQGNYEEFNRRCPRPGKRYFTDSGAVKIMRVNMFSRSITVCSDHGEEKELTLDEWEALTPRRAETQTMEGRAAPPSQR